MSLFRQGVRQPAIETPTFLRAVRREDATNVYKVVRNRIALRKQEILRAKKEGISIDFSTTDPEAKVATNLYQDINALRIPFSIIKDCVEVAVPIAFMELTEQQNIVLDKARRISRYL